jgi:hypothetical protein
MTAATLGLAAPPSPTREAPRRPTPEYEPRRPEDTLLHRVVRTLLASFLQRAAESHETGVPRFVDKELHGYLRCGVLAHGFCRLQCGGCSYERLVPLTVTAGDPVIMLEEPLYATPKALARAGLELSLARGPREARADYEGRRADRGQLEPDPRCRWPG